MDKLPDQYRPVTARVRNPPRAAKQPEGGYPEGGEAPRGGEPEGGEAPRGGVLAF
jgi:hypothetical protein